MRPRLFQLLIALSFSLTSPFFLKATVTNTPAKDPIIQALLENNALAVPPSPTLAKLEFI